MNRKKDGGRGKTYIAGSIVACLVLALAFGWGYVMPAYKRARGDVAFAEIGPLRIAAHGYAYRAVLAVQTGADDAGWAKKNTRTLNDAIQRTLAETDPRIMRTPAGLASVQDKLAQAVNASLDRPRVQRVLFTDFVIQSEQ